MKKAFLVLEINESQSGAECYTYTFKKEISSEVVYVYNCGELVHEFSSPFVYSWDCWSWFEKLCGECFAEIASDDAKRAN